MLKRNPRELKPIANLPGFLLGLKRTTPSTKRYRNLPNFLDNELYLTIVKQKATNDSLFASVESLEIICCLGRMTQYNRVLDDGVMILPSLLLNGSRPFSIIVQTHEADVSKHSLTRYLDFFLRSLHSLFHLWFWTFHEVIRSTDKGKLHVICFFTTNLNWQASERVSECLCWVTAHVSFVHLYWRGANQKRAQWPFCFTIVKYSSLSRKLGKLLYLFVEGVVRLSPKRKPGKFAIGFSSLGFRFSTESHHVRHAVGLCVTIYSSGPRASSKCRVLS